MPGAAARSPDPLLGGLTPSAFMARHWQRRPLLVRGAVAMPCGLPDRDALFALAADDDVESRLVTAFDGAWSLDQGPFDRLPRRKRDWTLLVQGVNLRDERADALMRRFDFASAARLDDLMMSYAAESGGVGPHIDSYDVFLLQVEGRRLWRWSAQRDLALVEGAPLKLLSRFVPTSEAVLEPGDMLYLPPSHAHDGVAVDGPCITASIGFRAPSWDELTREFLFDRADAFDDTGRVPDRHRDRGREATTRPAHLDDDYVDAAAGRLMSISWSRADVESFMGRYLTEPKPHVFFATPRALAPAAFIRRARAQGLRVDPAAGFLYRGRTGYIAGEAFALRNTFARSLRMLADERRLAGDALARALADANTATLLHQWWTRGWIRFQEGGADDVR